MKKFIPIVSLVLFCGWLLCACKDSDSPLTPDSITLDSHELTLTIGEEQLLTATVHPETPEQAAFDWSSSDPEVASVNAEGLVTALSTGEALITVKFQGRSDACRVTVTEKVDAVKVTPETAEVLIGETIHLTATVTPESIQLPVTWTSTNTDIATVDEQGVVTGIAAGNVIIMAQAGGMTDDCIVSVVGKPVESVLLSQDRIEINEGETRTITATVLPENADNKIVYWSSSDERIASVSGAGAITGKRPGEAVITARAGNCTVECHVTVKAVPLAIGHIYYSDGTWSATLDTGKTAIGVVYYVGDITASDPALAREHPDCTHGLVVSLQETPSGSTWQSNYAAYGSTVGAWIEANLTEYETILTDVGLEDNLNVPMGYNNTKAIEAFNAAAENSAWPVEAVEYVVSYRETTPAPASTSDWYLGSAKEMSLLATGEYDGNIWDIRDTAAPIENLEAVNEVLATIPGAIQIGTAVPTLMFYWTSTEMLIDSTMAVVMTTANGQMPKAEKSNGYGMFCVRPILAF